MKNAKQEITSYRQISLTEQQITALQVKELALFRVFIDVCTKLGLKYYVTAGTLLGAVRHQGFIPWDDDIDVVMFREDYEKLIKYGQPHLPKDLFLQTHQTDSEFPANFCKLRDSRTTFVERSLARCNINHGIYIDIFPLDNYPEKGRILYEIRHKLQIIRMTDAFLPSPGMKRITKLVRFFTRFLYASVADAVLDREHMISSVAPSKNALIINNCNVYRNKEIIPKDWYGNGVTLMFEGLEVTAPVRYHDLLVQIYGDYMQLPPEEKRIPHHFVTAFDMEKPYKMP